MISQQLKQN